MTPPKVNAYNNSAKNEIVFPAGILQPPFFYPEGDDAINYGAIGAVIGHEIIHGFDNSGRKFDAKGNQVDWWTAEDAKQFDEGANCIIKQFDGYVVDADVHQNGALVQGESIADLGGLTIAYRAYKKSLEGKPAPAPIDGLTGDQRFFVANGRIWASNHRPEFARLMAQTNEHPLGRFRVDRNGRRTCPSSRGSSAAARARRWSASRGARSGRRAVAQAAIQEAGPARRTGMRTRRNSLCGVLALVVLATTASIAIAAVGFLVGGAGADSLTGRPKAGRGPAVPGKPRSRGRASRSRSPRCRTRSMRSGDRKSAGLGRPGRMRAEENESRRVLVASRRFPVRC